LNLKSALSPAGRTASALPKKGRHRKATTLILVPGVAVLLAALGGTWLLVPAKRPAPPGLVTHTLHYDHLQVSVQEHGTLESALNNDIVCRVKSRVHGSTVATTLKWVVEDGSTVKRGDVLAELDRSGLEEDLKTENIALVQARSAWVQAEENYKLIDSQNQSDIQAAQITKELADLDLKKYAKGDYLQARQDVEGRLAMATGDLEMCRERVAWAERMLKKGYYSENQVDGERSRSQSAEIALDKVREELRVLERYTKPRTMTDLENKLAEATRASDRVKFQARAKILQANVDRLTKLSVYEQEKQRYREIEEQIAVCTLRAPRDGIVVYYIPDQGRYGSGAQQGIIAQGEPVHEGQILMHMPDLEKMQVETQLHEAVLAHVHAEERRATGYTRCLQAGLLTAPDVFTRLGSQLSIDDLHDHFRDRDYVAAYEGDPALIEVNAFPGKILHGRVKHVSNVCRQWDWRLTMQKLYPTTVSIDDSFGQLKPGMTADVTILDEKPLDHVLTLPLEAIVGEAKAGQHGKCFVVTPQGPQEREFIVGVSNDRAAEVKKGLSEGDEVVLNPEMLLGDEKLHVN
jgi:multidrug efflux pump subunit AcrA (membrane-fusion protein)